MNESMLVTTLMGELNELEQLIVMCEIALTEIATATTLDASCKIAKRALKKLEGAGLAKS